MYSRMIVYCISSALGLRIARKVMTRGIRIILDNMSRPQPKSRAKVWLARLGTGGVNTAIDLGKYWLVLKSDLVLTISKEYRLELPSLETGSSGGFGRN